MTWFLYKRYVASQDENLVVQYRNGLVEHLAGPRQLFFSSWRHESIKVAPICRATATKDQICVVTHIDGRVERIAGPCTMVKDPEQHADIRVEDIRRYVADPSEYVMALHRDGRKELHNGPTEVIFDPDQHESVEVCKMKRSIADPGQYLKVQFLDGRVQHVSGPNELCLNPFEHASISTMDAVRLAANEAVVVYRGHDPNAHVVALEKGASAGAADTPLAVQAGATRVDRRVVHGPAVFMPEANEWLHKFSWHGSIQNGRGSKTGSPGDTKVPHALNFNVLRCMPDQIYYTVRDVRTSDDAHLQVHLMIFYELCDIELMLDNTNDLIGDILSASSADTTTFAAGLTYEAFLQDTAKLSEMESFPILKAKLRQIGTKLIKVVYRGYSTSPQLQKMHDEAIARRTKLRLDSDAAREEQSKLAMELRCRQERAQRQQELEQRDAKHKLEMDALVKEQRRAQAAADQAEDLRLAADRASVELEQLRARHEEELRRERELAKARNERVHDANAEELLKLAGMVKLGVDVTKYLCALATLKPDSHLRIDSAAVGDDGKPLPPNVHVEVARGR